MFVEKGRQVDIGMLYNFKSSTKRRNSYGGFRPVLAKAIETGRKILVTIILRIVSGRERAWPP
jgi:hypothetical protein